MGEYFDDFEEEPIEFRPRFGGVVSCVDPDTGEEVGAPALIGQTVLAEEMLNIVRPQRPEFHSHREAANWYKLESNPPRGWEINTWYKWIRNRLWCARRFHMSYQKLLSAIRNEDKSRDWRSRYASD